MPEPIDYFRSCGNTRTCLTAAVQPPGLSYTAHWEALGSAVCLLTTPEISSTGPVRDRGFSWDFCCAASLLRSPAPCFPPCFSLYDLRLFVNERMLLSETPFVQWSRTAFITDTLCIAFCGVLNTELAW